MKNNKYHSGHIIMNKPYLKAVLFFVIALFTTTSLQAQEPVLKKHLNQDGQTSLKVENPVAYNWYLLYQENPDGSFTFLEAQASDGTDIIFSTTYKKNTDYQTYQYNSKMDPVPEIPDRSLKIRKAELN
jgi:hypothetical protein